MVEKKNVNQVLELSQTLNAILKKYPKIKPSDIEQFAPVYYPIALIEMDFDEQSFEDFESIQLAILQFVNAGINDPNIISASMGINNPNYIYNVLQLLKGYGHIDHAGITELGKKSLSEEKKITRARVKQQFQLDALNGNLLEIDQNLINSSMMSSNETIPIVGHLGYLEGIPSEYVEKQIKSIGFDHFKRYKSSILNANVLEIHDIHCIEVQYSKCYLIKLRSSITPTVFGKRFNPNGGSDSERFFWEPLCIDRSVSSIYFSGQNLRLNSSAAEQYINQLVVMLNEQSNTIDLANEVNKALQKWNSSITITDNNLNIHTNNPKRCATVKVHHTDFIKFNGALLAFLDAMTNADEFLISSPRLYGKIISIQTDDKFILYTIAAYREIRKFEDSSTVSKMIRSYISENSLENLQGEELFKAIFEFCRNKIHQP